MAPEPMHTAKDLARITGISYRTILAAINSGELESFRPSGNGRGTIYVAASAWDKWLQGKKTKTKVKGRVEETQPISKLALT